MPRCPSCGKGFKSESSVAMHMGQPRSGCNTWINNLVRIHESLHTEIPTSADQDFDSINMDVKVEHSVDPSNPTIAFQPLWVKVWIWVRTITQTQHQQRTTKLCEWWFTSAVSREDVLRRGEEDLHQQGDADRDAGYSWGTGAVEDEGDRCLDSSYSLGSVKAGIG